MNSLKETNTFYRYSIKCLNSQKEFVLHMVREIRSIQLFYRMVNELALDIETMNTIKTVFQRVLEVVSGLREITLIRNAVTTTGHVTVVLDAKMVLNVSPKSTHRRGLATTSCGENRHLCMSINYLRSLPGIVNF